MSTKRKHKENCYDRDENSYAVATRTAMRMGGQELMLAGAGTLFYILCTFFFIND